MAGVATSGDINIAVYMAAWGNKNAIWTDDVTVAIFAILSRRVWSGGRQAVTTAASRVGRARCLPLAGYGAVAIGVLTGDAG